MASRTSTSTSSNVQHAIEVNSYEQLFHTNQEFVTTLLDNKKDVWKSQELLEFVETYFDNSLKTMDFCAELEEYIKASNNYQLLLHDELRKYEEDGKEGEWSSFKGFRETNQFFLDLESVYRQQLMMRERLQTVENNLNKKLRYINAWRKVFAIIFTAATVVGSVVAAAVAKTPAAVAAATAAPILVGTMGRWTNSLFKKYENGVKKHKEIMRCMNVGANITIKDLSNVCVLAHRLELEIELLSRCTDFADVDEEAPEIAVEQLGKKLVALVKSIEELQGQAADYCRDIRWARAVMLQSLIKHP